MAKTHWKKLQNPDYLGAYALDEGTDLIATIKYVQNEKIVGPDGKKEECTVIHFSENGIKPMICNSTNAKTITKIYKTPYIEDWQGRKIQLYIANVKAFGEVVEALRVRPFVPKVKLENHETQNLICSDCKNPIDSFNGRTPQWMAQYTQDKYGKPLCSKCAKKASEDKVNTSEESFQLTEELKGEIDNA